MRYDELMQDRWKYLKKWLRTIGYVSAAFVGVSLVMLAVMSFLSDPYSPTTSIVPAFKTTVTDQQDIILEKVAENSFIPLEREHIQDPFGPYFDMAAQRLVLARAGVRSFLGRLFGERKLKGTETEIIAQIHQRRFDPSKSYVITGARYPDLQMRTIGIFYNAVLDPRLPTTDEDWASRQRAALQTVAFELDYLDHYDTPITTIFPFTGTQFTSMNVGGYPSDSLYAVVYTLQALADPQLFAGASARPLHTTSAGKQLMTDHRLTLVRSINRYVEKVLDQQTKLVRRDVNMAGAREGVKRTSSFYDNVMVWATVKQAKKIGLPVNHSPEEGVWKQTIIDTFWQPDVGSFKDDVKNTAFSADSLIVLQTGFLDPAVDDDRQKLKAMVEYVRQQKLDQPFPLKDGQGISSHWGMEYVKVLIMLGRTEPAYLVEAEKYLESYRLNIERFGGYPERYSVGGGAAGSLHTGWVVNYEQAKVLLQEAKMQRGSAN